ncbi:MAG: MBL fold metallo-hydrolase [Acidobacteriota bacterium]|nr:MBL fold metallo-hydrolase [Acidobacteriota bacterium]
MSRFPSLPISPARRGLCSLPLLVILGCCFLVGYPAGAADEPAAVAEPAPIEELAPGIHRIELGADGAVVAVDGPRGRLLVDSGSAAALPRLLAALETLPPLPVRLVINTHYHADHLGGNGTFRAQGAMVMAHANVATQARRDVVIEEWGDWHREPSPEADLPQLEIHGPATVHWGDERIEILPAPAAHTDGDLVLIFHRARLAHLGDLLEVGAPPFIDWWAGGSLEGILEALDRVLEWRSPDALPEATSEGGTHRLTRFVPGHGAVVDRQGLERYRSLLETVAGRVGDAVAAGKSAQETVDLQLAQDYAEELGGERRARQLVYLLYLGLSGAAPGT